MADDTETYTVEAGALLGCPCWNGGRARNWCATIALDPTSPGGLSRAWHRPGRGLYYYLTANMRVGDPLEFGADTYSSHGRLTERVREYRVVLSITATSLVCEVAATGREAIQRAAEVRAMSCD